MFLAIVSMIHQLNMDYNKYVSELRKRHDQWALDAEDRSGSDHVSAVHKLAECIAERWNGLHKEEHLLAECFRESREKILASMLSPGREELLLANLKKLSVSAMRDVKLQIQKLKPPR